MVLKESFTITECSGENLLLNGLNKCVFNDSYKLRTHSTNRFTNDYVYGNITNIEDGPEIEVWDIEVNDESHSFIANNCAVHNSVCTTRKKTGVGYPQLSAIIECADAAHGLGGMIMADGGCVYPGDFAKAFGGGADFVMAGGVFAGHDESGGELVTDEETKKQYKEFYGMSSATAMQKHSDKVKNYRASEGKTIRVPYRGPVSNTISDITGGLRSACTYVGASKLKDLSKRTTFIRVTQQTNDVFGNRT